jgi:hypothetical protein
VYVKFTFALNGSYILNSLDLPQLIILLCCIISRILTQDPHSLSHAHLTHLISGTYHHQSHPKPSPSLQLPQFSSSRDVPLVSLRRTTSNTTPGIGGGPRSLLYNSYNKTENNVLVTSDAEVSRVFLFHFLLFGVSICSGFSSRLLPLLCPYPLLTPFGLISALHRSFSREGAMS